MTNAEAPYLSEFSTDLKLRGFKVYSISHEKKEFQYYNRKDFFKICIITSDNLIHYADRSFETEGTILFFGNPRTPYSWEVLSPTFKGYCCLFSEAFLQLEGRSESILQSPLFKKDSTPVFNLTAAQTDFITTIFQRMLAEMTSQYAFKGELMRNYIQLTVHEALKMQPAKNFSTEKNAANRITAVFLDLLERQFPIESTTNPLRLRTAQDFAKSLAVHVNYLNRSVKETTGKPTSVHIANRVIGEAKALLKYTDWNVAEIANALGFSYPSYFNNYFKKMTGITPTAYRA